LSIAEKTVSIRDYGIAIPMDQLAEYVSERKRDGIGAHKIPQNTVLHYGIGLKVVNLLSSSFWAQSFEDWKTKAVEFEHGRFIRETTEQESFQPAGNLITFTPDDAIFGDFHFVREFVVQMIWHYVFLNTGLEISFGAQSFQA
jgi:topoisomerase-4 subunit B